MKVSLLCGAEEQRAMESILACGGVGAHQGIRAAAFFEPTDLECQSPLLHTPGGACTAISAEGVGVESLRTLNQTPGPNPKLPFIW